MQYLNLNKNVCLIIIYLIPLSFNLIANARGRNGIKCAHFNDSNHLSTDDRIRVMAQLLGTLLHLSISGLAWLMT